MRVGFLQDLVCFIDNCAEVFLNAIFNNLGNWAENRQCSQGNNCVNHFHDIEHAQSSVLEKTRNQQSRYSSLADEKKLRKGMDPSGRVVNLGCSLLKG